MEGTVCGVPSPGSGTPAGDTFGRSWPIRSQGAERQVKHGQAFAAESSFWKIRGMCSTIPVLLVYLVATKLVAAPRAASIAVGVVLGSATCVLAASLFGAIPLGRATVIPFARRGVRRHELDGVAPARDGGAPTGPDLALAARDARRRFGADRRGGDLARPSARKPSGRD